MDFVDDSRKLRNGKSRIVLTKGSLPSSPSNEEPQLSSSKKMKCSTGNGDSVVKKLDPLLIPEVVKIISGHLEDVDDLRSIRSLNRLWRDESLKHWRSSAVLVLTGEVIQALVQAYLLKNDPQAPRVESTSNDVFIQLFEKPFRNFRYPSDLRGRNRVYPLRPMDIGGPSPILWEQFFSKAKYLDLSDCIMKDEVYYLEGFSWIFQTCPELKRLDLNPYDYQENYDFHNVWDDDGEEVDYHRALVVNNDDVVVSNLETLSIGKTEVADLMDYISKFFRFRYLFGFYIDRPQRFSTPFSSLFQMCPNLKNLWTQAGMCVLLDAAQSKRHQLESVAIVPATRYRSITDAYLRPLRDYVAEAHPLLKTLVLRLDNWSNCLPRATQQKPLFEILNLVQGTLTKLELYIDCEVEGIFKRPLNLTSEVGTRTFSNLTHLKICQDYRKFMGNLISFDFQSLRRMKKLKEFRFEMGIGVAENWVKTKLGVKDIQGKKKKGVQLVELLLPDLKHFHFHSNFTSEAIQFLGKVATNLKTLEVVLDGENFTTALKTWPNLSQITLLPCSEVAKELYSGPEGLKIVDKSNGYRKATTYWLNHESPEDFEIQQMKRFCKLTKPRF